MSYYFPAQSFSYGYNLPYPMNYPAFPLNYMPWMQVVPNSGMNPGIVPVIKVEVPKKKYKRTWKRDQIQELYSAAKDYCQLHHREMDSLQLADFQIIGYQINQDPTQCLNKIFEIVTTGTLRPGTWSESEDSLLDSLIQEGTKRWGEIANILNTNIHKGHKIRTGKQCKERWNNHIDPSIKKGSWTPTEDLLLLKSHKRLGNRWSVIAKEIGNRTESAIKNRVKSLINKETQNLHSFNEPEEVLKKIILKKKLEISGSEECFNIASPPSGSRKSSFASFEMAAERK